MGLIPFGGKKNGKKNDEESESKGLNLGGKLKLLILVGILLGGSVGASGGATVYGFTHGAVTISDTFVVNTGTATGSFWIELENRGIFPLSLDVTFELRTVKGGLDLGSQTASFKLGPRGSDNQTLSYPLTPELLLALTNGAGLTFTPSAKGTYAWFIKISEKELDNEQLTVARLNSPPVITAIDIDPTVVEAGDSATIDVAVNDPDNDRVTLDYSLTGGSLLKVSNGGLTMTWQAPYQVGNYTFTATASDGIDISNSRTATLTVIDTRAPTLAMTSEPDLDTDRMSIQIISDEPLKGLPEAWIGFTPSGAGSAYNGSLDLTATGVNRWNTSFDITDSGEYELAINGTDYVGNIGNATAFTNIEKMSLLADQESLFTGENMTLTVEGGPTVTVTEATVTVTEIPMAAPQVPEELAAVGRFLEIEAPEAFKAGLASATIVVNYDEEDIAGLTSPLTESDLKLYFYNEDLDEWERQETLVDTDNRTLTAVLDHLSLFGVFGENVAPSADAGEDLKGDPGKVITFTATGEDVDGTIEEYAWDFNGDGVYDWNGTAATTTHTYSGPGEYTAKLRVTDDGGATGFDTVSVTVGSENQNPGWSLPGVGLPMLLGGLGIAAIAVKGRAIRWRAGYGRT